MKKISVLVIALTLIFSVLSFTACADKYEVDLPIGDGSVEGDNITCHYTIDGVLKDGYELKGYFVAEEKANLDDEFVFSISFDDRFSNTFSEQVLFSFKGEDLKNTKNGKLAFVIKFDKLTSVFPKTEETKNFAFHFHRKEAKGTDMIAWNESSYTYSYSGDKIKIEK